MDPLPRGMPTMTRRPATLRGYRRIAEAWPVCKELAVHPDRAAILARNPDGRYCAEDGAGAQRRERS